MISRVKGALARRVVRLAKFLVQDWQVRTCNVKDHVILLDVESEIEEFRANTLSS